MSCHLRRYVTCEEQTTKFNCFNFFFFFFEEAYKHFRQHSFSVQLSMQTVFPGFVVFFIFLTNYSDVVKFLLPKKIKSIQQVFTVLRARLLSVVMVTIIWLPTLIHALAVKEKKETSFCFFWSCHEMWFRWYIFVKKINKNPEDKNY